MCCEPDLGNEARSKDRHRGRGPGHRHGHGHGHHGGSPLCPAILEVIHSPRGRTTSGPSETGSTDPGPSIRGIACLSASSEPDTTSPVEVLSTVLRTIRRSGTPPAESGGPAGSAARHPAPVLAPGPPRDRRGFGGSREGAGISELLGTFTRRLPRSRDRGSRPTKAPSPQATGRCAQLAVLTGGRVISSVSLAPSRSSGQEISTPSDASTSECPLRLVLDTRP